MTLTKLTYAACALCGIRYLTKSGIVHVCSPKSPAVPAWPGDPDIDVAYAEATAILDRSPTDRAVLVCLLLLVSRHLSIHGGYSPEAIGEGARRAAAGLSAALPTATDSPIERQRLN
jgi:hypothetical protein